MLHLAQLTMFASIGINKAFEAAYKFMGKKNRKKKKLEKTDK